jgi:hypothetical protein
MSFRVEMTDGAYVELDNRMDWLSKRSSLDAADRLSARFYESLSRLEFNPFSCGLAYENRHFADEVRHLLFEVSKGQIYRALFTVKGDVVKILCVRAPGEKPVRPKDIAT